MGSFNCGLSTWRAQCSIQENLRFVFKLLLHFLAGEQVCVFCGVGSSGWPEIRTDWKIREVDCGADEAFSALRRLRAEARSQGKEAEQGSSHCIVIYLASCVWTFPLTCFSQGCLEDEKAAWSKSKWRRKWQVCNWSFCMLCLTSVILIT